MKLGLLGCGSVAYWLHLPALRGIPDATLVAAADPDPAARTRFARASGVSTSERSEDLLGRRDIDAVLICAPTHLHASLACAAAVAGKHFYLEKPIATSVDDARQVIAAAARAGITTAVGFNRRHHPLFERARGLLQEGAIGRVHVVQTTFCEPSPPDRMPEWKRRRATGGGVLLDLASHHIDQVRWMLETEVEVVSASVLSERTEQDGARLELTTDRGAAIQSFFSYRAGPAEHMEFIGEQGTLRLDRHAATLVLSGQRSRGYGTRHRPVAPSAALVKWMLERIWRRSADPSYPRALRAFVEQVRGLRPGTATLHDGLRSLEVVVAAEAVAAGTCASF
jgi:predicted dehydrogenase